MIKPQIFSRFCLTVLLVSVFIGKTSLAQGNYNYRDVDYAVDRYSADYLPLNVVAVELAELGKNEREKFRAIYTWISKNIEYDYSFTNYYAEETFRDRTGVCNGFATLFKEMCDEAGLKAIVVTGYAKGAGYRPGNLKPESNHAWNAICVGNNWYPVEATWASCIGEYDYYFMTEPERFIFSHLPLNESYNQHTGSWKYSLDIPAQLLTQPVDYTLWDMLPDANPREMRLNPDYYTLANFRNDDPAGPLAFNTTDSEVSYLEDLDTEKDQEIIITRKYTSNNTDQYVSQAHEQEDERPVMNEESIEFLQSFKEFINSPEYKALQKDIAVKTEDAYQKFKTYYESGELESDTDALLKDLQDWWESDSVESFKEETKSTLKSGLQSIIDWLEE